MPISTKNLKNGHNPKIQEVPEVADAEVVEEEMYAQESFTTFEDEEIPLADVEPSQSVNAEPKNEPKVEVKLRSFIPVTEDDFEAGFKLLTPEEKDEYGLHDRSLFRVREDAGKNIFKLSSTTIGKHVKALLESKPPYPRGYLMDEQGLTDRCMYEIFKKIENTAKNILPGSPLDWRNLKKTKAEQNPRYKTHRFRYWEEHSRRCQDYYNWLESQPEPDFEIHEAEFVSPTEEPPEDREERLSQTRSQIQLAEHEDERIVREYCGWKRERLLRIVEEEALETRRQVEITYAQVLNNPDTTAPPELDEEEDL